MYAANADYESEIRELHQYFESEHLPDPLRQISYRFQDLKNEMLDELPACGEKVAFMRKLLEAKDCAVRSALHLTREKA